MNLIRVFRWLMTVAAFVLPAGLTSAQRPEATAETAFERAPFEDILFRHYL